jgi:hypothetical protein
MAAAPQRSRLFLVSRDRWCHDHETNLLCLAHTRHVRMIVGIQSLDNRNGFGLRVQNIARLSSDRLERGQPVASVRLPCPHHRAVVGPVFTDRVIAPNTHHSPLTRSNATSRNTAGASLWRIDDLDLTLGI